MRQWESNKKRSGARTGDRSSGAKMSVMNSKRSDDEKSDV